MTRSSLQSKIAIIASGVAMTVTVACATPMKSIGIATPVADTSLFTAVVVAVRDSAHPGAAVRMRVDPRPLRADPSITSVGTGAFAMVPDSVVAARGNAIDRLGIQRGRGELPAHCPSVLSSMDSSVDRTGCPEQHLFVVNLALPRPASLASGTPAVAVRTTETLIGPGGWTVESYDYILDRVANGWILAKRKAVGVTE